MLLTSIAGRAVLWPEWRQQQAARQALAESQQAMARQQAGLAALPAETLLNSATLLLAIAEPAQPASDPAAWLAGPLRQSGSTLLHWEPDGMAGRWHLALRARYDGLKQMLEALAAWPPAEVGALTLEATASGLEARLLIAIKEA